MTTEELLKAIARKVASIRVEANLVMVEDPLLTLSIDDVYSYSEHGTPVSWDIEWEVSYAKQVYGYKTSRNLNDALESVLKQVEEIENWKPSST